MIDKAISLAKSRTGLALAGDRFIVSPTPNRVHFTAMHFVSFHFTPGAVK